MALELKPNTTVKLRIAKSVNRAAARKTIERLFLQDNAIAKPIEARAKNFKAQPKRRGGRIWTKWPNKIHPNLVRGTVATIQTTPQTIKDVNSVAEFLELA